MTWSRAGERVVAREPSMARSWVGLTMVACLPCMEMLWSREAHNSYVNCQKTEECYEYAVMSGKNLCQIRVIPLLRHKHCLRMSRRTSCREAPGCRRIQIRGS